MLLAEDVGRVIDQGAHQGNLGGVQDLVGDDVVRGECVGVLLLVGHHARQIGEVQKIPLRGADIDFELLRDDPGDEDLALVEQPEKSKRPVHHGGLVHRTRSLSAVPRRPLPVPPTLWHPPPPWISTLRRAGWWCLRQGPPGRSDRRRRGPAACRSSRREPPLCRGRRWPCLPSASWS